MKILAALLALSLLTAPTLAHGRAGQGSTPNSPSPPSSPPSNPAAPGIPGDTDTSAQRTNFIFVENGTARKTQNPGFCDRNPGDYYVRVRLTLCQ